MTLKTGVLMFKNSALHHRNNTKNIYIRIENSYFKLYVVVIFHNITVFTVFVIKINAAFESRRDFFQQH